MKKINKNNITEVTKNIHDDEDLELEKDKTTTKELVLSNKQQIVTIPLSQFVIGQYVEYANEVLLHRSFPSPLDGLKPVQRRILYAMFHMGCTFSGDFKKSARIVGETMGKYHPHGDSSIYEALVILGQSFKTLVPLIEPQGNFGSLDGDSAAASRYTEAKLSSMATQCFFDDLDKDIVDFENNYDGTEQEPIVLPVKYPNLLVNGSMGIGVSASTYIPSHNIIEVLAGIIEYHKNPRMTIENLRNIIPAPDFPTGGKIYQLEQYSQILNSGKGMIKIISNYQDEQLTINKRKNQKIIVITDIPPNTQKEKIVEKMRNTINDNDNLNLWIKTIRDESTRENGVRIVLYLTKQGLEIDTDTIISYFYNDISQNINYNMNVIGTEQSKFRQMSFFDIFNDFLTFRFQCFERRAKYILSKNKNEQYLMEGIIRVLHDDTTIEKTVEIIKNSKDSKIANQKLCEFFNIDEIQAKEVLKLSLQKLTSLELNELKEKYNNLEKNILDLEDFLQKPRRIKNAVHNDLVKLHKQISNLPQFQRKTQISYDNIHDYFKEKQKNLKPKSRKK